MTAACDELGVLRRHPDNPLLTAADVPYPASLVFNAGVAKYRGRYVMVFRDDYGPADATDFAARAARGAPRFDGTLLGWATSDHGIAWRVESEPCMDLERARKLIAPFLPGLDPATELHRFYDPRLTVLEGRVYMCFAVDTAHGLRGGIAVTENFVDWELLSLTAPDNRNLVLLPERIGGSYVRLERPINTSGGYAHGGDEARMWTSSSPDLVHWGRFRYLLGSEEVAWANDKLGPGAPPLRTDRGWLTTFHAVWRDDARGRHGWEPTWPKIYRAGLMLTALDDPGRVLGRCVHPLLVPTAWYETGEGAPEPGYGFRHHVVFPGGAILEDDGEVKVYYGAADTVECLATAPVDELVEACLAGA